jgi:hypothetical protein
MITGAEPPRIEQATGSFKGINLLILLAQSSVIDSSQKSLKDNANSFLKSQHEIGKKKKKVVVKQK